MANKIFTPGYLVKRLRESGFIVIKMWQKYSTGDPRRWTILIDPGDANLFLTCYMNYPSLGDVSFEFNDGGNRWPRNFMLNTGSIEVLVMQLLERNISTWNKNSPFFKDKLKEIRENNE